MALGHISIGHVRRVLECQICFDEYQRPKELDCRHSFCQSPCLEQLVDVTRQSIRCPVCSNIQTVTRGDVSQLKYNRTLQQLIDVAYLEKNINVSSTDDSAEPQCEICVCQSSVDLCIHCDMKLCENCREKHTKDMSSDIKALISHTVAATNVMLEKTQSIQYPLDHLQQTLSDFRKKLADVLCEIRCALMEKEKELNESMDNLLARETDIEKRCTNLQDILDYCRKTSQTIPREGVPQETLNSVRKYLVKSVKTMYTKPSVNPPQCSTDSLSASIDQLRLYKEPEDTTRNIHVDEIEVQAQNSSRAHINREAIEIYNHIRNPITIVHGTALGSFSDIISVAISPKTHDIAISDRGRHVVSLFNIQGQFKKNIGCHGSGSAQFNEPRGVTFTSTGRLIVADSLNHRIQIFSDKGCFERTFSRHGKESFQLNKPYDVCVDAKDKYIFVCDHDNNRIQRFNILGGGSRACFNDHRLRKPSRIKLHCSQFIGVHDASGYACFNVQDDYRRCHYDFENSVSHKTPVAFSENGHILVANDDGIINILSPKGDQIPYSFPSTESICGRKSIKDLAIRKGHVVVAGSDFVEFY